MGGLVAEADAARKEASSLAARKVAMAEAALRAAEHEKEDAQRPKGWTSARRVVDNLKTAALGALFVAELKLSTRVAYLKAKTADEAKSKAAAEEAKRKIQELEA